MNNTIKRNLLITFFGFLTGTLVFNYLIISYLLSVEVSRAYFFSVLIPSAILSAFLFTLFTRYWNRRKSRKKKEA